MEDSFCRTVLDRVGLLLFVVVPLAGLVMAVCRWCCRIYIQVLLAGVASKFPAALALTVKA